MINEIEIANFKAFGKSQRVPVRPITLIFGANSSGKSSIIHTLLLAHHAATVGEVNVISPVLAGEAVDLGGFRRYVHKNDPERRPEISVSAVSPNDQTWRSIRGRELHSLKLKLIVGNKWIDKPAIEQCEFWLDGQPLGTLEAQMFYRMTYLNADHPYFEPALSNVSKKMFDGEVPVWRLAEVLTDLAEVYNYRKTFISDFYNSNSMYGTSADEGQRDISEILYSSLSVAASYEDPELEKALEEFENDLRGDAYSSIWHRQGFEKLHETSNSLESTCALANKLENSIIREVRLHALLSRIHEAFRGELEKLDYLGPLRTLPSRAIDTAKSGDANWRASGGFAWKAVMEDHKLQEKVNSWLSSDFLNTKYRLESHIPLTFDVTQRILEEAIKTVKSELESSKDWDTDRFDLSQFSTEEVMKNVWHAFSHEWASDDAFRASATELIIIDLRTNTRVSHRDVGIGISQILPVLVHAYASSKRLIAIEQPELHLHPGLQAELGDVFIESALGESGNQLILETHSEHLILRLMRRIRETSKGTLPEGLPAVTPKDVAILYVEPTNEGSIVRQINLDEEGQLIDAWPGGFFEEGFRERFA